MQKIDQRQLFEKLISQNKGILFKVAKSYCQDEVDRQDLIQEMMVQVWLSLDKYNNRFKISTWLYRIALNVAISYYRKNRTRTAKSVVLNEKTSQMPEDDKTENELNLNLLERFISELNEIDKALIILYLEDKSHAEIAETLGMSVSNVGTKVGRIKDRLKQRFSQLKLIIS